VWPRERQQANHQAAQRARRHRATAIYNRVPSPFPPPPCAFVIPNRHPLPDVKMYKFVHYFENTPVYVRDDVLPYLLSISGPEQFQPECTLEFIFNLSILRSLVPDFPEGLIATPLQPVTLICSPCTSMLLAQFPENFTPEANQLAWYRDTLLHRTFFGNQNYWDLRFYFRYLNINDMNYLNRLQSLQGQVPTYIF